MQAAHVIELLGALVVRLQIVVRDRPRGRQAIGVLDLLEVLAAEPIEHAPPELGIAADAVVRVRAERTAPFVQPLLVDAVAEMFPHRFRIQFSSSRGTKSPRSITRMRAPESASACTSVPPPAPVPMMMMS
jgi:hypothetical protein